MSDRSKTPDYLYDPNSADTSYDWYQRDDAMLDEPLGAIKGFETLFEGPMKWAAHVVLTWDEDGAPDETEIQWFDTKEAAEAALGKPSNV